MSILLAQTDTTVGFLSNDAKSLEELKSRPPEKQFLKVYPSFKEFKKDGNRVPQKYKNLVRRAAKTTFIIKGRASRIVKDPIHLKLLKKYSWLYSTSANKSGHRFDKEFCLTKSDIIIEDTRGFKEDTPSSLYKLNNVRSRRLR
ncbi:Sua5/YciO/YrdC/YwlC family protein [Sulfurimonas sp. HSL3-2]|uniref:Sua5/YciO/YrdC/YwlC family protein n=1 Tax=Hydrocurvibacter mobilis TaxID=3131936 RepID=UPI0031F814A9